MFNATYDKKDKTKVSYTTSKDNAPYLDTEEAKNLFGHSVADANGNISIWKKDGADDKAVTDWIAAHYSEFGGTEISGTFDDTNSTVSFKDLDFGYYYIKSSLGSVVTIDSVAPKATVYDKNETTPTAPIKKIVSVDGTEITEATSADAHVGSVIGFKVTANTNNWVDEDTIRTEYVLEDTPTNMTINADSVQVKVNGEDAKTAFTATVADGKLTVTIPMVDDNNNSVYAANKGTTAGLIPVEVTYTATIDAAAADSNAKNSVKDGDHPDNPGETTTDTYKFKLKKVGQDGEELLGAQFQLYKGDTLVKFTKNTDGSYTYNEKGSVDTIDLTSVASAVIKGLDNKQDYTLKETKVPDGYNQAEDVTVSKGTDLVTATGTAIAKEVMNEKGALLPSTGGMGTTMLYVVGGILVAGAAVLLITRRRVDR